MGTVRADWSANYSQQSGQWIRLAALPAITALSPGRGLWILVEAILQLHWNCLGAISSSSWLPHPPPREGHTIVGTAGGSKLTPSCCLWSSQQLGQGKAADSIFSFLCIHRKGHQSIAHTQGNMNGTLITLKPWEAQQWRARETLEKSRSWNQAFFLFHLRARKWQMFVSTHEPGSGLTPSVCLLKKGIEKKLPICPMGALILTFLGVGGRCRWCWYMSFTMVSVVMDDGRALEGSTFPAGDNLQILALVLEAHGNYFSCSLLAVRMIEKLHRIA